MNERSPAEAPHRRPPAKSPSESACSPSLRGASRRWRHVSRHRRDVDVARDANANNAKRIKDAARALLAVRHIITTGRAVLARPATAVGLFRLLVAPLRAEVVGREVCPRRRLVVAGRADPLLDELCDSCVRRRALAARSRRAVRRPSERRRAGRGLEAEAVFVYFLDAPARGNEVRGRQFVRDAGRRPANGRSRSRSAFWSGASVAPSASCTATKSMSRPSGPSSGPLSFASTRAVTPVRKSGALPSLSESA